MALISKNDNEVFEDPFAKKAVKRKTGAMGMKAKKPVSSKDEDDEAVTWQKLDQEESPEEAETPEEMLKAGIDQNPEEEGEEEPEEGQESEDENEETGNKNKEIEDTSLIGENTDGRVQFFWQTRYPASARRVIKFEAVYNCLLFVLACILVFLNYLGVFNSVFAVDAGRAYFTYMIYFATAGLMGGAGYEIKVLCHVVAKGYWNLDRHYWRLLSPLLSMGIAVIIGAMAGAGLLSEANTASNAWAVALGFFSGYFSVNAVTKMREMAEVVFGASNRQN